MQTTGVHPKATHLRTISKRTIHWHEAVVTVTAYVVNRAEVGKCDVYWQHRTATGTKPQVGTAAVDPRIFPFGTRFIVPGYGYAVARDTGGAVDGRHIDLVTPTCREAFRWGTRRETVKFTTD